MGIYLNPGNDGFRKACRSEIYVDKSNLISYTNKVFDSEQQYICVSRPRRFGKSMAANMLAAYYSRECDSRDMFSKLSIAENPHFGEYMNACNVVFLNMQEFLSETHNVEKMIEKIEQSVLWDLLEEYQEICIFDKTSLTRTLMDIFSYTSTPFVFIIDEWDCIFRENKNDVEAQKLYLDFLRNLLKDRKYVKLAYMTGILPVKKYGTHSALNMFDEFSMTDPGQLAEYVGFTEPEVKALCSQYQMDFEETKRWYDGYHLKNMPHIYSPRSVVQAMLSGYFSNYWTKTETYEALKIYIEMKFDGLRDTVIKLLAGGRCVADTGTFTNDMMTFQCADDVLTLLVHLGYLGYDFDKREVYIPNSEVSSEFVNAVRGAGWNEVANAVKASEDLLQATWRKDAEQVAEGISNAHMETSILTYNDENALAYTMSLAYYSARVYYTVVREFPTGKGFEDLVFVPRSNHLDKPVMIVELKWDKTAEGAISQIKNKQYTQALQQYKGNLLLVGINYDKGSKVHTCQIEEA